MKTNLLLFAALVSLALAGVNCDLGINPLIFDGLPATATFRVDSPIAGFDVIDVVNLQDVVSNIDAEIDSIKVYNITLQIDSTAGTQAGTTVYGLATIDNDSLFVVNNAAISLFSSERSIFDPSLAGKLTYVNTGVSHLVSVLRQRPLPVVTVQAFGTASSRPIHATIRVKAYTEVFTPPPK